jgi:two-component system, chemotaxis family, chemotaxis protein CheY
VDNPVNISLTGASQDSRKSQCFAAGMTRFDMTHCIIIDSRAAERAHLSRLLESLGLQCTEHSLQDEALLAFGRKTPDLVIMQQTHETREFIKSVSGGSRKTKVIVYADAPSSTLVNQSIMDGAAEFLVRPFDRDLLAFKLSQTGLKLH